MELNPNMNGNKCYDSSKSQDNILKILHLTTAPFPEYNGTTARLVSLLSKLPMDMILITKNKTTKNDIYLGNIKIKRVLLSPQGIFANVPPIRYIHTIYKKPILLASAAESELFDIIHVHDSALFIQSAKRLRKISYKPLIFEFHAVQKDYVDNLSGIPHYGRIVDVLYVEKIIKNTLNFCDCIITLTEKLKNWISNHYKINMEDIAVVPNGVDINKFCLKDRRKVERLKKCIIYKIK